jgi:hypothetical protein
MDEPFTSKPVRGTDGAGNQPLIPFEPVPLRHGNDGWTVEKQYAFIEALAETGIAIASRTRTRVGSLRLLRFGGAERSSSLRTFANIRALIVIPALSRDPPFLLEQRKAGRPRIKSGVTGVR